jgi:hypothetical protein
MPQSRLTHRDRAIVYIAGYETADAGRYEREVTRVARRWLGMLGSRHTTQGMVNKLLDEVASTDAADFGCAWDDLKRDLHRWALEEGWLEPPGATPHRGPAARTGKRHPKRQPK